MTEIQPDEQKMEKSKENYKSPKFSGGHWKQQFLGYFDWPPAKWGMGNNEEMVKKGKSPMEIWEVHSEEILKNHKTLKQYHESILTEYEKSKEEGQTIIFWEKYWKDTYDTTLPNPYDMEERWNVWIQNGYDKEQFWEQERKKFNKESGWSFWKNKVFCQERHHRQKDYKNHQECFNKRMFNNWLTKKKSDKVEDKPLFQMFDF